MRRHTRFAATLAYMICALPALWCASCSHKPPPTRLSPRRYIDPKGYFTIVPPDGWRIEEYSEDPRGKVAFICPDTKSVDLRVLVNVVGHDSFDRLMDECRSKEAQLGFSTNIEEITFAGYRAVRRHATWQQRRVLWIEFLAGRAAHFLQYLAPDDRYDTYLAVAMKSIETYEPLLKEVADADRIRSIVAKKIELARMMMESGNLELALQYVEEGLELAPTDADLLRLRRRIQQERSRR